MAAPRVTRRRGQAGFTLVEVMIAMVVTIIGLTVVVGLLTIGMRGTSYARHATEATVLAEDQLEILLLTPPAALADGADRVDAGGRPVRRRMGSHVRV